MVLLYFDFLHSLLVRYYGLLHQRPDLLILYFSFAHRLLAPSPLNL